MEETSCGLKLFKEFLQSKPKKKYSKYSSRRAAVSIRFELSIRFSKKNITRWLKDMNCTFSWQKLLLLPLEHKIIFCRC